MKHTFLFGILYSILLFTGCSDFLEVPPKDFMSDEEIWKSTNNADLFLNDIYDNLKTADQDDLEQHMDQLSDNSDIGVLRHEGYRYIGQAQIAPESYPSRFWDWENLYTRIRKPNIFIQRVSESELPDDYKTLRIAEARFIWAYFYHILWMSFGGVPIITVPQNNLIPDMQLEYPRSTAAETFQFIVDELDAIYNDLPLEVSGDDYGRATKGAVLALKGWCELFHASELRNPANDTERWKAAAKTNKALIDLNVYDLVEDFPTLFLQNNNEETIFARQYGPNKGHSTEGRVGPARVGDMRGGWGNFQPTQDLVDEFSMANGKTIFEEGSGYDPANPYAGREKRFYQTIIYDNSTFHAEIIQTRIGGNNEINKGYSSDNTHTGYYARKRLNEDKDPSAYFDQKSYQNYILFRFAEALLSYAEAENEVNGPTQEVLNAVNRVRTRSGNLPSVEESYGTVTKDKMREIIRRERRVELSFEDKRWWDILRWKIAETMPDGNPGVMNRPLRGMEISENPDGTLNYNIVEIRNRLFLPKMYYMPVPQAALDRNSEIRKQDGGPDGWKNGQNPGY
ncbi:MAG: RagB/SusD family nutrient uptake outer membrane protein [Tannerellaceae bacterium]|nr:RagB/SusD family nutrient uptake outer membrane protein [Tannerellaceae bacterium]MCD8263916.1 RagB/SusD family nutrient uptake outer membrane protein [Tannerellaceae bacterium]